MNLNLQFAIMAEPTDETRSVPSQDRSESTTASIAQFELSGEKFALDTLFEDVPDAQVKINPAVANPDDYAIMTVQTDEREHTVKTALQADPGTAMVERFGECRDGWMYRVEWANCPRQLLQQLVAEDITLLSAEGQSKHWKLRLVAPDRTKIVRATDVLSNINSVTECKRISTFDGDSGSRLTAKQREALITAFETGYYNIPQDTQLDDIADKLGISHQACSERVHRACKKLIEDNLSVDDT